MLITHVPESITEILNKVNVNEFERTVRKQDTYHYKHKDGDHQINIDLSYQTLTIKMVTRWDFVRKDSIMLNLDKGIIRKFFSESNGIYPNNNRILTYQYLTDEAVHFQESLICDNKYFPSMSDVLKLKELYDYYYNDTNLWDDEMEKRQRERNKNKVWTGSHWMTRK